MKRFPPLELEWATGRGRLVLRPFGEADIAGVAFACADPVSQRWLVLPSPYTERHARAYVEEAEAFRLRGAGIRAAIAEADTGALVGAISLKETDWRQATTDVGYWAVPTFRGRGYISAATRAVSDWALGLGLTSVTLRAVPENLASNRVARAAGFRFLRALPSAGLSVYGRVDLNLYARTAEDRDREGAAADARHPSGPRP